MPLISSSLASQLESILVKKPDSVSAAASDWANAYLSYASAAMSSASSLPVTATANLGILIGAFNGAFSSQSSATAASLIATGVQNFWTAMVWAGATATGSTAFPGNSTLSATLSALFADTSESSEGDKASKFADAFDLGAKQVIASELTLSPPPVPIVGPIS